MLLYRYVVHYRLGARRKPRKAVGKIFKFRVLDATEIMEWHLMIYIYNNIEFFTITLGHFSHIYLNDNISLRCV